MFELGISAAWLRRAQWAIYVFFGGFALAGLWFVFASALRREVFDALISAGVVWGSIGLGIGMHCVTQMAAIVDANTKAVNDIRRRADAMEALLEQLGPLTDLSAMGPGDPAPLVAACTTTDAFPRIAPLGIEPLDLDAGDVEDEEEHLLEPVAFVSAADQLRTAFRDAVHAGDFAGALGVGEQIAHRFPGSAMAVQFETLREVLRSRIPGDAVESGTVSAGL